jgi:hypothetical protein
MGLLTSHRSEQGRACQELLSRKGDEKFLLDADAWHEQNRKVPVFLTPFARCPLKAVNLARKEHVMSDHLRVALNQQQVFEFHRSTNGKTVVTSAVAGRTIACLILDDPQIQALQRGLWKLISNPEASTVSLVVLENEEACLKLIHADVIGNDKNVRHEWIEIRGPGKTLNSVGGCSHWESDGTYSVVLCARAGNDNVVEQGGLAFQLFRRWTVYNSLKIWMSNQAIDIEETPTKLGDKFINA